VWKALKRHVLEIHLSLYIFFCGQLMKFIILRSISGIGDAKGGAYSLRSMVWIVGQTIKPN
jgi:hypothetical protein